jgi:hypothetical protein
MNIDQRFVEVDARILPAPSLQYKEGTQPMNTGTLGAWNLRQVLHSGRLLLKEPLCTWLRMQLRPPALVLQMLQGS